MRELTHPKLKEYRRLDLEARIGLRQNHPRHGVFMVGMLRILASSAEGWDHVSISLEDRCPTWDEMERVKRLFFKDDETAMQLHVPPSEHISHHPYCLHLWRPHGLEIPRPPAELVGAPA